MSWVVEGVVEGWGLDPYPAGISSLVGVWFGNGMSSRYRVRWCDLHSQTSQTPSDIYDDHSHGSGGVSFGILGEAPTGLSI